jgi:hypothetical protein
MAVPPLGILLAEGKVSRPFLRHTLSNAPEGAILLEGLPSSRQERLTRVTLTPIEGFPMPGPEKRLPGQANADYERRHDPNSDFIGVQSAYGGGYQGGWTWQLLAWVSTRRAHRNALRNR